jgi:hypothetical protein
MRVTVRGGGPPRCLASSRTAANRDAACSNSHGSTHATPALPTANEAVA